jgi:excisionase family DNA binding protein
MLTENNVIENLVPFEEACTILGYKRSYLYAAIADGRLKAVKVGKYTRIPAAELRRFRNSITRPFHSVA